jgi:hypothetical protein
MIVDSRWYNQASLMLHDSADAATLAIDRRHGQAMLPMAIGSIASGLGGPVQRNIEAVDRRRINAYRALIMRPEFALDANWWPGRHYRVCGARDSGVDAKS